MATINITIEKSDDELKEFAIDRGWEETKIEVGKDSKGIPTRSEIPNPILFQDYAQDIVKKILVDNFAEFEIRKVQADAQEQIKSRTEQIHDELNSKLSVEIL